MGNQPNNFIQCGLNDKDTRQEVSSTRQQAIKATRGQHIFKPEQQQRGEGKSSTKSSSKTMFLSEVQPVIIRKDSQQRQNIPKMTQYSKKQPSYFPQHQNLVRVSKNPKNGYTRSQQSQYYQEEKGKCLDEIIQSRYNTTMHFPQYQIRGLLESLVYSLAYMSKKDINHHDFYPTNIFYNNGSFKISNPLTVKCSGYSITQQRKRFSFLSPELILQILNDKNQADIRKDVMDKSDVFAIGMILLEFSTLTPSSQCYDPETYSIIDFAIQERLQKITRLYNPLIADCISMMLEYQVDKRIPPIQLAYAVHSKAREMRIEEISEKSRVQYQQNSNNMMSMSNKFIQQPGPPGFQSNPRVISQKVLPREIISQQIISGEASGKSPVLVASNQPPIYNLPPGMSPPQVISSVGPRYPGNMPPTLQMQNLNQAPQTMNNQAFPNPSQVYSQAMKKQYTSPTSTSSSTFTSSSLSTLGQPTLAQTLSSPMNDSSPYKVPIYVTSENKTTQINKNPYLSVPASNMNPSIDLSTLGYNQNNNKSPTGRSVSPNSKMKLNPFQEIQEAMKEDDEEYIQKNKVIQHKTALQADKLIKKQSKTQQIQSTTNYTPKSGGYTFRTTSQPASYLVGNFSSTATNASLGQKKQQSLDQRVRKILEATKNIK